MNARHTCALPALAFSLAVSQPVTPARADEAPLKISSADTFRGTQSVVIGAFNVGFIFQSIDNTKATGGMIGAFGGTTRAKSELVGVTPDMMQAITDAAYADFTAQLTARGFTVGDSAAMFAHPAFTKVKSLAAPYDANIQLDKRSTGKASYYKPSTLPGLVILPGDITASGFSGMGTNMTAGTNQYGLGVYTKASGQTVIDVVYLIDFSDVKKPGAFSLGGGLTVNSGMSVVDDFSKLHLITPAGKTATITINQPVAVEGDFAERADATKGAGVQKAANVASGLLGGLSALGGGGFGGMKFGKSKTFTFTAKDTYKDGAVKAATLANARLVEQLAALR